MANQLPSGVPLSSIPAGKPPPGIVPNFAHPNPTLQPALIGGTVSFMSLGLVFAAVNTYHRRRDMLFHDWIIVASSCLSIGYSALVISYSYAAVHVWDISLATISDPHLIKLEFAQDIFTAGATFVAKCAILTLYMQVFDVSRPLRYACYFGFFLNLCAYLPPFISAAYLCAPHAGDPWNLEVGAHCAHDLPVGVARSSVSTLLDIYLFILPIAPVVRLKISRRKKRAILLVFGTALLGIVASVCSLVFVITAFLSDDSLWYGAIVELCNIIEVWIAIIVASMPGFAAVCKTTIFESGLAERITTTINSLLSSGSRGSRAGSSSRHVSSGRAASHSDFELQNTSHRQFVSISQSENGIGKTIQVLQTFDRA